MRPAAGARGTARRGTAATFLLLSGHNERAVIALARYFTRAGLPFVVASAGAADAIRRTAYAPQVVFERIDRQVTTRLFTDLAAGLGLRLLPVPTTEFVNAFALAHADEWAGAAVDFGLPEPGLYARLTSKQHSQALLQGIPGLVMPAMAELADARAPCVLKPRVNTHGGTVLYPLLCETAAELAAARAGLDPALWFAQAFVRGQSHYFCAYLSRDGRHAGFWQENLMQQAGGKSIVLARECGNPGLSENALVARLQGLGYHGPLMLEVIATADGELHYIETNPRFWGPLQLALDACPQLLDLYATDRGLPPARPTPRKPGGPHYYAWAQGAACGPTRALPALADVADWPHRLIDCDVYGGADTAALHACH